MPDSAMPALKKSGKRNIAVVVANPPPECPQMPARSMSIHGYRRASCCMPAIWSGIVLSRPMAP